MHGESTFAALGHQRPCLANSRSTSFPPDEIVYTMWNMAKQIEETKKQQRNPRSVIFNIETQLICTAETRISVYWYLLHSVPRNRWDLKDSHHVASGTMTLRDMPGGMRPETFHQQPASSRDTPCWRLSSSIYLSIGQPVSGIGLERFYRG